MISINDSFDGSSIALRVGEMIEITLTENASTGYRWTAPADRHLDVGDVLREVQTEPAGQNFRPGMPGVRRFHFEALGAGNTELQLEYRRPWAASAMAVRTFRLRVEVRAADGS
jgi:inhibitor of cysteine peptidase